MGTLREPAEPLADKVAEAPFDAVADDRPAHRTGHREAGSGRATTVRVGREVNDQ